MGGHSASEIAEGDSVHRIEADGAAEQEACPGIVRGSRALIAELDPGGRLARIEGGGTAEGGRGRARLAGGCVREAKIEGDRRRGRKTVKQRLEADGGLPRLSDLELSDRQEIRAVGKVGQQGRCAPVVGRSLPQVPSPMRVMTAVE